MTIKWCRADTTLARALIAQEREARHTLNYGLATAWADLMERALETLEFRDGGERFKLRVWPDGQLGVWVSYDAVRDIYSQGASREEALDAIGDAVRLYDAWKDRTPL